MPRPGTLRPTPLLALGLLALGFLAACGPDFGPLADRLDRLSATAPSTPTNPEDPSAPGGRAPPTNPAFPPSDSDALEILPGGWVELTLDATIARFLTYNPALLDKYIDEEFSVLNKALDRENPKLTVTPTVSFNSDTGITTTFPPKVTWTLPTGTEVELKWNEDWKERAPPGDRTQTVTFIQPLWPRSKSKRRKDRDDQIEDEKALLGLRKKVAADVNMVITKYRELVEAFRGLERSEAALERAREQLDTTNTLISVGRVARRDALQAQSQVTKQELALIGAQRTLRTKNRELGKMLALADTIRIRPIEPLAIEPRPIGRVPELAEVLANDVDYQLKLFEVEEMRDALSDAEDAFLPSLDLTLTLRRTNSGPTSNTVMGSMLTFDLDRRRKRLDHLRARNTLRVSEKTLVDLQQDIQIKLENVVQDLESNLRELDLSREARELAEDDYAIEQNKFRLGLISSRDVARAADTLVSAQEAEVEAIKTYQTTLIAFDMTTGQFLSRRGISLEKFPR